MSSGKTNMDVNPEPQDIRPLVANKSVSNWGLYTFLAVMLLGGYWIFSAMNAARIEAQAPSTLVPTTDEGGRISSPNALNIPQRFTERAPLPEPPALTSLRDRSFVSTADSRPNTAFIPPSAPIVQSAQPAPVASPLPTNQERVDPVPLPRVVFENRTPSGAAQSIDQQGESGAKRVMADRFKNPSRTVPKGTVIPAVLETALDSTRPGGVRALVQRNVKSFDGTRILIQRGSRLYGEYDADLEQGQKRAKIQWTRLIRPDGVTIALDSPASDPLGRAGVKGKVDSKFLQRFGGAILQSFLDLGVNLASREVSDQVVVALPGATQNVQVQGQDSVRPTLKVKHGTSVSVFVARDLDFSTVDS